MGQGEESKTRSEASVEIQERGEIFFFYRLKVDKEEAHSLDDVQRFYIVLRPESGERSTEEKQDPHPGKEGSKHAGDDEDKSSTSTGSEGGRGSQEVNIEKEPLLRFIVIGRKSLPDPNKKSRRPCWGYVEMVTTKFDDVKAALQGEEYDTKTRGHRRTPPARALGEGIYRILRHNTKGTKKHTHLVYKLEFPREHQKQEPQESFNVEREGSFVIQIKNPGQHQDDAFSQFRGLGNKRKATFPAHLQGQLGKTKFSPADPPDFLNYEGCEFLLIPASDNIEEELGLELKTETGGEGCHEGDSDEDASSPCGSDLVKTFWGDHIYRCPSKRYLGLNL